MQLMSTSKSTLAGNLWLNLAGSWLDGILGQNKTLRRHAPQPRIQEQAQRLRCQNKTVVIGGPTPLPPHCSVPQGASPAALSTPCTCPAHAAVVASAHP